MRHPDISPASAKPLPAARIARHLDARALCAGFVVDCSKNGYPASRIAA